MKVSKIALAVSALLISGSALAHGYISNPPSRDYICKLNNDTDKCGGVVWEPQGAGETTKGFPNLNTVDDGKLVSGNIDRFGMLDAQTATLWDKNPMKAGENSFSWHFTAKHKTTHFEYFITKQDWDQNKPLSRESFETNSFCKHSGDGKLPESNDITHSCDVPERTGYQVIYAAWQIDDTGNSFYKAIDVDFGNEAPSIWANQIGKIQPQMDLIAGDSVKVRIFSKTKGELLDNSVTLNIDSDDAGKKETWGKALAELINNTWADEIRAGRKDGNGDVNPSSTINNIYVKKGSQLNRVEFDLNTQQTVPATMKLGNIKDYYMLDNGAAKVTLDVTTTGNVEVKAQVLNLAGKEVGSNTVIVNDRTDNITVDVAGASEGKYKLVVLGTEKGKPTPLQGTAEIKLQEAISGVDYTYPNEKDNYQPGTRVLQTKTQKVYECKQGAESGWCKIYSASTNQYEPGVGSNWKDAWIEMGPVKK